MVNLKKHIAIGLLFLFTAQSIGAYTLLQLTQSVLVITPFVNTEENADLDYLREGLSQAIYQRIDNTSQITVIGPEQNSAEFNENQVSTFAENATGQFPAAGEMRTVVNGQYISIGSMIKIDIRLSNSETSSLLEKSFYLLEGNDLDEVTNQIVSTIVSAVPGVRRKPVIAENTAPETIHTSPEEPAPGSPVMPVVRESKAVTSQWWYWVLMGAGVAGGAYGIYTLIQSDANTSTVTIDFPLP